MSASIFYNYEVGGSTLIQYHIDEKDIFVYDDNGQIIVGKWAKVGTSQFVREFTKTSGNFFSSTSTKRNIYISYYDKGIDKNYRVKLNLLPNITNKFSFNFSLYGKIDGLKPVRNIHMEKIQNNKVAVTYDDGSIDGSRVNINRTTITSTNYNFLDGMIGGKYLKSLIVDFSSVLSSNKSFNFHINEVFYIYDTPSSSNPEDSMVVPKSKSSYFTVSKAVFDSLKPKGKTLKDNPAINIKSKIQDETYTSMWVSWDIPQDQTKSIREYKFYVVPHGDKEGSRQFTVAHNKTKTKFAHLISDLHPNVKFYVYMRCLYEDGFYTKQQPSSSKIVKRARPSVTSTYKQPVNSTPGDSQPVQQTKTLLDGTNKNLGSPTKLNVVQNKFKKTRIRGEVFYNYYDFSWDKPSNMKDVNGFKLYKVINGSDPVGIKSVSSNQVALTMEVAKIQDLHKFYVVSVDKNGKESNPSNLFDMKPFKQPDPFSNDIKPPKIIQLTVNKNLKGSSTWAATVEDIEKNPNLGEIWDNYFDLSWENPDKTDNLKKYKLYMYTNQKTATTSMQNLGPQVRDDYNVGKPKEQAKDTIMLSRPGVQYTYFMTSVGKNGKESARSNEVTVSFDSPSVIAERKKLIEQNNRAMRQLQVPTPIGLRAFEGRGYQILTWYMPGKNINDYEYKLYRSIGGKTHEIPEKASYQVGGETKDGVFTKIENWIKDDDMGEEKQNNERIMRYMADDLNILGGTFNNTTSWFAVRAIDKVTRKESLQTEWLKIEDTYKGLFYIDSTLSSYLDDNTPGLTSRILTTSKNSYSIKVENSPIVPESGGMYEQPYFFSNGKYVRVKFKDSELYFDFMYSAGFSNLGYDAFEYYVNTDNKNISFTSFHVDHWVYNLDTKKYDTNYRNWGNQSINGNWMSLLDKSTKEYKTLKATTGAAFRIMVYYTDANSTKRKDEYIFEATSFKGNNIQSAWKGLGHWANK